VDVTGTQLYVATLCTALAHTKFQLTLLLRKQLRVKLPRTSPLRMTRSSLKAMMVPKKNPPILLVFRDRSPLKMEVFLQLPIPSVVARELLQTVVLLLTMVTSPAELSSEYSTSI
jgi:hypothetical protein